MKQLIIAEKPSLWKTIQAALSGTETFQVHSGYSESEHYILTFAFGHLFRLKDVEEYPGQADQQRPGKWNRSVQLPFVPNPFEFELQDDDGVKKQFAVIQELLSRKDISEAVNCGDSDREGEIIVRLILEHAGNTRPVKRLWLPDQSPATILDAIRNMKDDREYDSLANEGLARTYMDWLVGINLTRYLTYAAGKTLPVGRVLIPIVKAVYDRDTDIRNFVPTEYYQVESNEATNGEKIRLTDKNRFEQADLQVAQQRAAALNQAGAVVQDIQTNRVTKHPGKLFSLSKLQGYLSKREKIGLKESLAAVQSLYEKGFVTYPRTNTEYLATGEKDKVKKVLEVLTTAGIPVEFKDKATIFDDSKIESHSALTPTVVVPKEGQLSQTEQTVYTAIRNRFISNFLQEETLIDHTVMTICCGDTLFELKGDVIAQPGFLRYEQEEKKADELTLPKLKTGDAVNVCFRSEAKKTKPPTKLTAEALSEYLKHPFRKEKKDNDEEEYRQMLAGVEIGTEATRTGIIENAKKYGYVSEKSTVFSIEPLGEYLVQTLDQLQVDLYKEKTVEFGKDLKAVYRSEKTIEEVLARIKEELTAVIRSDAGKDVRHYQEEKESVGLCPVCGKPVYDGPKSYYCSGYQGGCKFALWKDNKFFTAIGKELTKSVAHTLLSGKKVLLKGCKSKKGTTYDANVSLSIKDGRSDFDLEFPKKK